MMWLVVLGLITLALAGAVVAVVVAVTRRPADIDHGADSAAEGSTPESRTWLDPLVSSRPDSLHSEAESLMHQAPVPDGATSESVRTESVVARDAGEVAAADAVQHALASLR